jgi:hypothetical protein
VVFVSMYLYSHSLSDAVAAAEFLSLENPHTYTHMLGLFLRLCNNMMLCFLGITG